MLLVFVLSNTTISSYTHAHTHNLTHTQPRTHTKLNISYTQGSFDLCIDDFFWKSRFCYPPEECTSTIRPMFPSNLVPWKSGKYRKNVYCHGGSLFAYFYFETTCPKKVDFFLCRENMCWFNRTVQQNGAKNIL